MRKLDPDGNGNITFMEFINAYPIWAEILEDRFTLNDNYRGNKVKPHCASNVKDKIV